MFCGGLFTQVESEMNMLATTRLYYKKWVRLANNDTLRSIRPDSKEIISKPCQIFKAKLVNSRI